MDDPGGVASGGLAPFRVCSNAALLGAVVVLWRFHRRSQRHRADQLTTARRAEGLLRLTIDAAPIMISWKDMSGRYLGANRAFAEAVGRDEPELIGRTDGSLGDRWPVDPSDLEIEEAVRVSADGITGLTSRMMRADGRKLRVRLSVLPLKEPWGEVLGVLILREDATRRLEIIRMLAEAREAAEAASDAKTQFLANMSHEIRTPLAAILGYLELLESGELGAEESAETVRVVRRNSEHLMALLNDLLNFSKLDVGAMRVEVGPRPVWPVIESVRELMAARAASRKLTLTACAEEGTPAVAMFDEQRLRQVLANLVGNAVKFTGEGGFVRIVVSPSGLGGLAIDVTDNGIGIEASAQSSLFEPFHQADNSLSRRFGGTGLGLSISRRLMQLMDGTVELAWSQPGAGSRFRVTLAAAPGAADAVPADQRPVPCRGELRLDGVRVLLADDGPDNQRLYRSLLERAGASVDVVGTGQAAVEAVRRAAAAEAPYKLVLMDMQMPVMDGEEATRVLRAEGATLPILAFTAHAMPDDAAKHTAQGFTGTLVKPVRRAELIKRCAAAAA